MTYAEFFENLAGGARWDVGVSINRSNSLPLDANSVFASKADLDLYAAGTPKEGTLANAYPGQVVAVVTESATTLYYIDQNMAVQEVGAKIEAANASIEIVDGKITLGGFADAGALTLPQKQADGSIKWVAISEIVKGDGNTVTEISAADKSLTIETTTSDDTSIVYTAKANISSVEGNTLELKEDGLYVATPEAYDDTQVKADIKTNADAIGKAATETEEATGLYKLISDEATARANADKDIADSIGEVAEGKTVVEMISDAEDRIKDLEDAGYLTSIPDEYITEGELSGMGYQTADDVAGIVDAAIAEINHAVFQKVDAIPAVADAVSNVLYLVPNGDKLDIYAKIGEEMVLIDDTDTDLTDYAKTDDVKKDIEDAIKAENLDQYATDLEVAAIDERLIAVEDKVHEHANKTLLDTYTQTEENLADAVAKKHAHTNGTVLDGITAEKVAAWDIAEKNVIASVDEAQFAIDSDRKLTLLDIAQSKITGLKNAAGNDITLDDALDNKVEKNGTDRLITEAEAAKLELLVIDEETGQAAISGTVNANQVQGLSDLLDGKVDKVEGMGLSANNFTDSLLEKLNGIAAGAQVNVIESVKVNGTLLDITEKSVNIDLSAYALTANVPTTVAQLTDADNYALKTDIPTKVSALENDKKYIADGDSVILNGGSAVI